MPLARVRAIGITAEIVFLVLFVGALAWVPFWLGSNKVIAWAINAILFPGLLAGYELSLLARGIPHPVALRSVRLSAGLFATVVVWILFQNATWTPSGWQHPIWQLASEALDLSVTGSISIDRDLTSFALLRLVTSASVFWLALQLCRDRLCATFLLWSIVAIGAVYAGVGLFAVAFMPGGVIFDAIIRSHVVTSTFVNHSHYATFAGIGLLTAVGLILRLYRRELSETGDLLRLKIAALIGMTGGKAAIPLALAFLILAALLLSASRGGIGSTAFGLLVLFALIVRGNRRSGRHAAIAALVVVLLFAIVFIAFGDAFLARITGEGVGKGIYDEGRLLAQVVTIRSILSAPLLGYGYGTFEVAFPMFRDDSLSVWGFWDRLHNTYLEVFQGLGLVFGAMLIGSVVLLVWRCLKGAATRRRGATVPAIAASVSFLVGVHALVDFSLQIQAVTLTYMAVLGAGVAQSIES